MAGRIPQHFIDQLLNRIDIVDLIDGYVPLKKAGANYKACCPFHNEKTPSFTVSASKQFYHCFGCGENGTAISFLMKYDHLEFREAIEKLAASAGLDIPEESQSVQRKPAISRGIDLYDLMARISDYFQQQLRLHPDRAQAVDYLKQRGVSGETAKRFALGFAPEGWDHLLQQFGVGEPAKKALLDAGMLSQNEKQRVYDRFRHRIMFPITDHRGRIVGFGGRVLGEGEPKYLNSPETPIFHKGSELYGLYAARGAIKQTDSVLVVEGYMDVVALAQAGIDNVVATLGTATTAMHLQRLFRHTHNLVFSFDGDRAGQAAAWKALQTCLPLMQDGYQVSFLFLPDGEDPDSMVSKVGRDEFLRLIGQATPLPDYLLATLQQQADIERLDGRAKLAKLAQPLLTKFPNGVLKKLLAERLSRLVQLSAADLLAGQTEGASGQRPQKPKTPTGLRMTNVRRAISLLLQYPQFASEYQALTQIEPQQVRGVELIHELYDICQSNPKLSTAALLERFRGRSFFESLRNLVDGSHNRAGYLNEEETLLLIRDNVNCILEEHAVIQRNSILEKLSALESKAAVVTLSDSENQTLRLLKDQLRQQYSNRPS